MQNTKTNKWRFLRRDHWEDVDLERWTWSVEYDDGSTLDQFDSSGVFHQFAEIDHSRVSNFKLINNESQREIIFSIPKNAKLIHFYRNQIRNAGQADEYRIKLNIFGYETSGLFKIKNLAVITPDDSVIITDNPDKIVIN